MPHFPNKWFQLLQSKISKKNKICSFQTLTTLVFDLKVAPKSFSKKLPLTKCSLKYLWMLFSKFLQKWFKLWQWKIDKKPKNSLFKRSEHSFLISRYLQNHFLRSFLWPNSDLNSVEHFTSLSHKIVSTSSLNNLPKTKKILFPSAKKILFWAQGFNFVTQKFAKNWKMLFSNDHNTRFWAQDSFKTIF